MPKLQLIVSSLDKQHNRIAFDCGEPELNDYLKKLANQHIKTNISRTFVVTTVADDKNILGFYTLSAGSVAFQNIPSKFKKIARYPIPIIRLGRLAVDKQSQGKRIGEFLLMDALHRCASHAEEIGIFGVVVDAKHQKAKDFYLKYGFCELTDFVLTLSLIIKNEGV